MINKTKNSEQFGVVIIILLISLVIMRVILMKFKTDLEYLPLVFSFIMSLTVAIEAKSLKMGSEEDLTKKGKRREGPLLWFIAVIVVTWVFLPLYFKRREHYGMKKLWIIVLILVLIDILLWYVSFL